MEKDFEDKEAIKKLKSLAEDIRFCMYTTYNDGKIESRPMTTLEIDTDGNVWFFTSRNTEIGEETNRAEPVTLIYSDPKSNTYISVSGKCSHRRKRDQKRGTVEPNVQSVVPGRERRSESGGVESDHG
jgi:general stress protein 26